VGERAICFLLSLSSELNLLLSNPHLTQAVKTLGASGTAQQWLTLTKTQTNTNILTE